MTQGPAAPSSLSQSDADAQDGTVATARPRRMVGTPATHPALTTLKLYAGEWAAFVTWCRQQRRSSLPATDETLAAFLLDGAAGLSRGTIGRRRSAVAAMHRYAGLAPPRLDAAARKAVRAASPPPQARPAPQLSAAALKRLATKCPRDLAGLRDRALLLLVATLCDPARHRTRSSALQQRVPRLVLLTLDAEAVRFTQEGAELQLAAHPDQVVSSRSVALARGHVPATCPVRALEDWLRGSDTSFGPVFRKVDRWGNVEHARLGPDSWYGILARRGALSGSAG